MLKKNIINYFPLTVQSRKYIFLFVLIFSQSFLSAQTLIPVDSVDEETESIVINEAEKIDKEDNLTKSPWGALWRSFVLPGWGQIYVENYWKAPIFIAATGTCIYFIISNNAKYLQYQKEYDDLLQNDPSNTSDLEILNSQKEFYRDNRDKSYFFLGITYIVAAIDAYVGAYLFDFEINDDLSLRLSPYYFNHPGINAAFRIK